MWESIPPVSVFEENQLLGCQQIEPSTQRGPSPSSLGEFVLKPQDLDFVRNPSENRVISEDQGLEVE